MKKTPPDSVAATRYYPAEAKVIDLTDKMDENGKLKWDAPAGKWTILRMGYGEYGGLYPAGERENARARSG